MWSPRNPAKNNKNLEKKTYDRATVIKNWELQSKTKGRYQYPSFYLLIFFVFDIASTADTFQMKFSKIDHCELSTIPRRKDEVHTRAKGVVDISRYKKKIADKKFA